MKPGMRIAAAVWLCVNAGWAADWKALRPQGYVSDYAGALDYLSRRDLDTYCAALEHATGAHLSLVVIGSLQREPMDAVAQTIFKAWAANANQPEDNRVLLLIATHDRRDSVVAGRALQAILTPGAIDDALSQVRPALSRRQYGQALMAAADEIGSRIAAAHGKTIPVHLTRRARRTFQDSIPWPLIAGGIPIVGLLIWLLRRPRHRPPPAERA